MGNKAYYADRQLVNSSHISRNSKLQIYRTLVRPVVTYGSESWALTMEEERALEVFEKKILRKIYGPVKKKGLWRIRRNDELEAIIKGENIVRFINPLNPELKPICYLLALLGAHHFLHVSRIRVKLLTLRLLMSYIYMEHAFLMFLDHTQRRSTVGRTPLDE